MTVQVKTAVALVKTEGVAALWSGWQASLARSFFYGGTSPRPASSHSLCTHEAPKVKSQLVLCISVCGQNIMLMQPLCASLFRVRRKAGKRQIDEAHRVCQIDMTLKDAWCESDQCIS